MTSLLDMLKETDLRLNFTDTLRSPTAYESLDRAILRPRLLLCLHGIGTNAGLQRMNAAQHGATYKTWFMFGGAISRSTGYVGQ